MNVSPYINYSMYSIYEAIFFKMHFSHINDSTTVLGNIDAKELCFNVFTILNVFFPEYFLIFSLASFIELFWIPKIGKELCSMLLSCFFDHQNRCQNKFDIIIFLWVHKMMKNWLMYLIIYVHKIQQKSQNVSFYYYSYSP